MFLVMAIQMVVGFLDMDGRNKACNTDLSVQAGGARIVKH